MRSFHIGPRARPHRDAAALILPPYPLVAGQPARGQTPSTIGAARPVLSAVLRKEAMASGAKRLGLRLAYDPTNLPLYCQAFDGAIAGMVHGRIIASLAPASYLDQTVAAGVWAQEFDLLWDSSAPIDVVQASLVYGQSYAEWAGRSAVALTAAQCAANINAILVAITEAETFLAAQGITPPPFTPVIPTDSASTEVAWQPGGTNSKTTFTSFSALCAYIASAEPFVGIWTIYVDASFTGGTATLAAGNYDLPANVKIVGISTSAFGYGDFPFLTLDNGVTFTFANGNAGSNSLTFEDFQSINFTNTGAPVISVTGDAGFLFLKSDDITIANAGATQPFVSVTGGAYLTAEFRGSSELATGICIAIDEDSYAEFFLFEQGNFLATGLITFAEGGSGFCALFIDPTITILASYLEAPFTVYLQATAPLLVYTPTTPAQWPVEPATVQQALDLLANEGSAVPGGAILVGGPYVVGTVTAGVVFDLTTENAAVTMRAGTAGQQITVGFVGTEAGHTCVFTSPTANMLATGYMGPQSVVQAGQVGSTVTFTWIAAANSGAGQWLRS